MVAYRRLPSPDVGPWPAAEDGYLPTLITIALQFRERASPLLTYNDPLSFRQDSHRTRHQSCGRCIETSNKANSDEQYGMPSWSLSSVPIWLVNKFKSPITSPKTSPRTCKSDDEVRRGKPQACRERCSGTVQRPNSGTCPNPHLPMYVHIPWFPLMYHVYYVFNVMHFVSCLVLIYRIRLYCAYRSLSRSGTI
jgi:hypothetical protein